MKRHLALLLALFSFACGGTPSSDGGTSDDAGADGATPMMGIDCESGDDCPSGAPICDATLRLCTGCAVDTDCPSSAVCSAGLCVAECGPTADCADGSVCISGACQPECSTHAECGEGRVCRAGACAAACTGDDECGDGQGCAAGACAPTCDTVMCDAGRVCESGTCVAECTEDAHCADSGLCLGGVCAAPCTGDADCGEGYACAGSACTPTCTSDDECAGSRACVGGVCAVTCGDTSECHTGTECCGGGCVSVDSNRAHCGACDAACSLTSATAACASGACAVGSCDDGHGDCDGDASTGCEVDFDTDAANCGACGTSCTAGQGCAASACVDDCRLAGAVSCAEGTVCDFTDGACRAPDSACLLTGAFESCGAASCGPGTTCDPATMACVAFTACSGVTCDDLGRCWGTDCPCTRPTASCASPTATSAFLYAAVGLDIDDECNFYTTTVISGTDYVRRLAPDGTLTEWTGVTNLDMGEIAVQRRPGGPTGAGSEVAFAYACCSSCGCASTPPQGVGRIVGDMIPLVVPAVVTDGAGPFGNRLYDAGPAGLSVSAGGNFFVGNVEANGDYHRYDVATDTTSLVQMFPSRVYAATSYDLRNMMVALEGGDIYIVPNDASGTATRLGALGSEVRSVRRDRFTGLFFASLRDGRVVSFRRDLSDVTEMATYAAPVRIALSPDGGLYSLELSSGVIHRVALPPMR